jgi:hypothetical protein
MQKPLMKVLIKIIQKDKRYADNLTKKDGYRVQLSAYADMFEARTGFKVSGIRVMPYVLERSDDGIITGIETDLPESRRIQ